MALNGENGSRWNNNLWIQVLTKYGVVGAIAAYLVYLLGTQFIVGQQAINQQLVSGQQKVQFDLSQHIAEQRFYLHAICINVARDETARSQCEPFIK